MNKICITGRLTADPETRSYKTKDGAQGVACNFSLAVNGMRENEVDFFRCSCFGKAAELIAQYCSKGDKLTVHGSIHFSTYTNKDGMEIYTHTVNVDGFEFMSRPREEESGNRQTSQRRYSSPRR